MAWNPSPEIADLRELAKKWKSKKLIVVSVTDGKFAVHSYGLTPAMCAEAKRANDQIFNLVKRGTITP